MSILPHVFASMTSYLLGTFPSSYIIGKLFRGTDIRRLGDQNLGAANACQSLGKLSGIAVFLVDCLKGALAVTLSFSITEQHELFLLPSLAVIAGHNWPIFLNFKGGRGASTLIGILLIISPKITILLLVLGSGILTLSKNTVMPLGICLSIYPVIIWISGASHLTVLSCIILMLLVCVTHRSRTTANASM